MRTLLFIFLGAFALSAFPMPFIKQMALRFGFVDAPAKRKIHANPIPLLGGLAIFGGALTVLIWYFASRGNWHIIGILASAALVALVGLIDDRQELSPKLKLAGQMIAFFIVAYLGVRVQLNVPLVVNYGLTIIWFAIITNAVNFLDNMDGLCAGVAAVAASFVLLLGSTQEQFLVAPIAAAMMGACLGFLRYNFPRPKATIFMGDAGSLFLGFMLSILALQLRFPENSSFVTWMVPLFILGVPLFDLTLVVISRLRKGVNPLTTPGKDHTSHRLTRMGYTRREAVLILYIVGGVFGLMGVYITKSDVFEGYLIAILTLIVCAICIVRLEKFKDW